MDTKLSYQRLLYTFCAIFLCITDQRVGSAYWDISSVFVYLSMCCFGLIILSAYHLEDFLKWPYAVWTVVWLIMVPFIAFLNHEDMYFLGEWSVRMLSFVLFGYLIIRTFFALFIEKKRIHTPPAILIFFCIMMFLMCISKSDQKWPLEFFIVFGVFFVTPFSKKDYLLLLKSLEDGIIISFLLLTEFCWIFRPYDELRYLGAFSNPNINALFYSMAYCAMLCKYCNAVTNRNKDSSKIHRMLCKYLPLFGMGCIWSLVFFTMARSIMISMMLSTVCAGVFCLKHLGSGYIRRGLTMGMSLILSMVISFPLMYTTTRYLPAIIHKPIIFYYETRDDAVKVAWFDPVDSPKYTDWRDILGENLLRVYQLINDATGNGDKNDVSYKYDTTGSILLASDEISGKMLSQVKSSKEKSKTKQSGDSETKNDETELLPTDSTSSQIRMFIYKYYLSKLNFTGHKMADHGVQVTKRYEAPHAHDIFLQFAFDYGIIAGLMFFIWIMSCVVLSVTTAFRTKSKEQQQYVLHIALFLINLVSYSFFEYSWGHGMLSLFLLFLLPPMLSIALKVKK